MWNNAKLRKTVLGGLSAAVIAAGFVATPGISSTSAKAQAFGYGYGYGYGPHYGRYHRWGGHPYYRHHRRHYGGAAAAGIVGLAAGAVLGSVLSQPRYYDRPAYYGRPAYTYQAPSYYGQSVQSGSQIRGGKHNGDPSQPIIDY